MSTTFTRLAKKILPPLPTHLHICRVYNLAQLGLGLSYRSCSVTHSGAGRSPPPREWLQIEVNFASRSCLTPYVLRYYFALDILVGALLLFRSLHEFSDPHFTRVFAMGYDNIQLDTMKDTNGDATVEGAVRYDPDNAELTRLGKKPVLKVCALLFLIFVFECLLIFLSAKLRLRLDAGFCLHSDDYLGRRFAVSSSRCRSERLLNIQRLFSISFTNGGFAGTVYEFIFVWLGTLASFSTMGELASMWVQMTEQMLLEGLGELIVVQGAYCWWAVSLDFNVSTKIVSEVRQLSYRYQVFMTVPNTANQLTLTRLAHHDWMASYCCIWLLPMRLSRSRTHGSRKCYVPTDRMATYAPLLGNFGSFTFSQHFHQPSASQNRKPHIDSAYLRILCYHHPVSILCAAWRRRGDIHVLYEWRRVADGRYFILNWLSGSLLFSSR
jgi:hypothetical protein